MVMPVTQYRPFCEAASGSEAKAKRVQAKGFHQKNCKWPSRATAFAVSMFLD